MLQDAFAGRAADRSARTAEGAAILVVEDEPLLRELISETLELEGASVVAVASAADALAILRSDEPIGILFTDIDLPGGMDGYALGREARTIRPRLQVIYTSGARPSLDGGGAVRGSTFIPKPYRPFQVSTLLSGLAR